MHNPVHQTHLHQTTLGTCAYAHPRENLASHLATILEPDEITLDIAKRLIAYKQKISEEWLEKKNDNKYESDTEVSEDTIKIKNKK